MCRLHARRRASSAEEDQALGRLTKELEVARGVGEGETRAEGGADGVPNPCLRAAFAASRGPHHAGVRAFGGKTVSRV